MSRVKSQLEIPAIDTTSFKRFPNARAFLADFKNFPYYQRHLQLLSQMHGEICGFCSKSETVENMRDLPQDVIDTDVVFLEHGICPRCRKTRTMNLAARHWAAPQQFVVVAGQRSGKDYFAALASLYAEHLMLTLDRDGARDGARVLPHEYFHLIPATDVNSYLRSSFIGCSGDSAVQMFRIAAELRRISPWFKAYRELLDRESIDRQVDYYTETGTSLTYHHTQMRIVAEAADSRMLRGPTRYFTVSNDLAWLVAYSDQHKACDVNKSIENSLKSVRMMSDKLIVESKAMDDLREYGFDVPQPSTILGQHLCVTTRQSRVDLAADLKLKALLDHRIHVREYAVWEFNPHYTRKDFDVEFAHDRESALRDFAVYKAG